MRNSLKTSTIQLTALACIVVLLGCVAPVQARTSTIVFLTSGTSWTVPGDWTSLNNTIEVIGGGGGGANGYGQTNGGGGGGYSRAVNVSLTPGATVTYAVGSGGTGGASGSANNSGTAGGDTYFCNSTSNCASISGTAVVVGAKGGSGGSATGSSGGSGGASSSGVGFVKYSGGTGGGSATAYGGGGGGGAGGQRGAGATGGADVSSYYGGAGGGGANGGSVGSNSNQNNGGTGGNGPGGSGGGSGGTSGSKNGGTGSSGGAGGGGYGATSGTNGTGGAGGASAEWDATHGPGGGGGGGGATNNTTATGGAGGSYGGGGGAGGGWANPSSAGGNGAQGIIVISYGGVNLTRGVKFSGNLTITGSLTKSSGTFVIDHPLDPKNKLLYHSFVESPDAKNIYDGIAILDEKGEATITLPDYFLALNKDVRYQFSALGKAMPDLYIQQEVKNNQFVIAGGAPGGRVSWQVSGIRHDPYILKYPIRVEVEKGTVVDMPKKGSCIFEPLCQ